MDRKNRGKERKQSWKKVWKTTDTCEKKIKGTFLKVGYEKKKSNGEGL